jgi:hypothetical protein
MYASWGALCAKLDAASAELINFCAAHPQPFPPATYSLADEFYLEGLISHTWQAWCDFCRECVIASCMGTVSGSGVPIAAHPFAASDAHVSGAVLRAKRRKTGPPYWGNINTNLRLEPTWGDVDVLSQIIPRLAPANTTQLVAALSSGSRALKTIQIIRNATSHRNPQTLNDVKSFMSRYIAFPIQHPVQALFWIDPITNDFLALQVIDDIRDIAQTCIS